MHPETKNSPKNMSYQTLTENSTATTKPWFSRLLQHPARKWSGSVLGHKHTCLFTYLPRTHTWHQNGVNKLVKYPLETTCSDDKTTYQTITNTTQQHQWSVSAILVPFTYALLTDLQT